MIIQVLNMIYVRLDFQIIRVIKIKYSVSHGTEWLPSAPAASTSFHAGPMCRDAAQRAVMLRKRRDVAPVGVTECLLIHPTRAERSLRTWSPSSSSGDSLKSFPRISV